MNSSINSFRDRPVQGEAALAGVARALALMLAPGDVIALSGPLGAGKTTFARAAIRALAGDDMLEVPSPSFSLVQDYDTAHGPVFHFDLYRLEDAHETVELGLDDATATGICFIEWPDRLGGALPGDSLAIDIAESEDPSGRVLTLAGNGGWSKRLERMDALSGFLTDAGWDDAARHFLQGDASAKRYERLKRNRQSAILMDMPPPERDAAGLDETGYAGIARISTGLAPFVALSHGLRTLGLSAPEIIADNVSRGFVVAEDLGDITYGTMSVEGRDMDAPYEAAIETLAALAGTHETDEIAWPGGAYRLPEFSDAAVLAEVSLFAGWYWPYAFGDAMPGEINAAFGEIWTELVAHLHGRPKIWTLRDFHSPNLMWLDRRKGPRRAGLIDFQDAVMAHPAYDLVSLLQDARVDVPEAREADMLEAYFERCGAAGIAHDRADFARAYAVLGAQRNTKIIGIFARLAKRDGKPGYLAHLPRVWRYLERDLEHPALARLKGWFDRAVPPDMRRGAP